MEIIFREKYVEYNEISDVQLENIEKVLIANNIDIELDNSINDWVGFSYYYCKSLDELDEETICSFIYIITWFMTGDAIDINSDFKSEKYYKNDKIINDCLNIYNNFINKYDSEIDLCKNLFEEIYNLYKIHHRRYVKKTERINFVLTYYELKLFESVEGKNRTEKLKNLLDFYNK